MSGEKVSSAQRRRLQKALATVPYAKLLGFELESLESGTATLCLDVREELTQNQGVVHGGAIASLVDTTTAFAILSLLAPKERISTVDLTISYLRPVSSGRLRAVAKVIRAGRRLFVVSAEVFDEDATLVTTALSTYIKI
jgi:uncharacterized protein (TIGR00369 family)